MGYLYDIVEFSKYLFTPTYSGFIIGTTVGLFSEIIIYKNVRCKNITFSNYINSIGNTIYIGMVCSIPASYIWIVLSSSYISYNTQFYPLVVYD